MADIEEEIFSDVSSVAYNQPVPINNFTQEDAEVIQNNDILDLNTFNPRIVDPEENTGSSNNSLLIDIEVKNATDEQLQNWETNPDYANLKRLLNNDENLKLVYQAYQIQGGFLTEKSRKILVHRFVDLKKKALLKEFKGESLEDWTVNSSEFLNLAALIERVFPTENAAMYFSEFKIENGVKVPSTGKLRTHFDYVKGQLRQQGVIKPFTRQAIKASDSSTGICVFDDSIRSKIEFLETHSEDVDQVKKLWTETYEARRQILKIERKNVHDYCSQFKALKENLGCELINIDFDILYPEKGNNLSLNWGPAKEHIINILKTLKLQKEDKPFLDLIPSLSKDNQDAVVLYLILYAVPTAEAKRSKKRKSEGEEVQNQSVNKENVDKPEDKLKKKRETYLLVISIPNEEDASLDALKVSLLQRKLTLQPIIVIVGSIINVQQQYVVIDDAWYKFENILECIAFTFKSFFVLDCAYPAEAYNVWHFIQRAIYEIKLEGEKTSLKIKMLERQMEHILKKRV